MLSFFSASQLPVKLRTGIAGTTAALSLVAFGVIAAGAANAATEMECKMEPTKLFDREGIARGVFDVEVCHWSSPPETEASAPNQFDLNFMKGKTYYYLVDGFTCKMNSPTKTEIDTWVNTIQVQQDWITLWGDKCNDAPLRSDLKLEDLTFSESGLSVTYKENTFEFWGTPPKF